MVKSAGYLFCQKWLQAATNNAIMIMVRLQNETLNNEN